MDAQHLELCRKLTAFMDLRQLLSAGLHIWHLHLLLCFQHHFVDALQQPALPVATLLLYSSIIEQRKHMLLKSLQKSFITVHIKRWFGLGQMFSVIPFQAFLITLWKHTGAFRRTPPAWGHFCCRFLLGHLHCPATQGQKCMHEPFTWICYKFILTSLFIRSTRSIGP